MIAEVGRWARIGAISIAAAGLAVGVARDLWIVHRFGAVTGTDAYYASMAIVMLVLGCLSATAEVRLVPALAMAAPGRETNLDRGLWVLVCAGAILAVAIGVIPGVPQVGDFRWGWITLVGSIVGASGAAPALAVIRAQLVACQHTWATVLAALVGNAAGASVAVLAPDGRALIAVIVAGVGAQYIAALVLRHLLLPAGIMRVEVGRGLGRLAFSQTLNYGSLSVDRAVALALGSGSVTALAVADRIWQAPAALIASSVAVLALPDMTRAGDTGWHGVSAEAVTVIRDVVVPVAVAIAVGAHAIIRVIVGGGATDTLLVAAAGALAWFAVAMPLVTAGSLYARVLIATGGETPVVWLTSAGFAVNAAADVLGASIAGVPGIAIATLVAASTINAAALATISRRHALGLHQILQLAVGQQPGRYALLMTPVTLVAAWLAHQAWSGAPLGAIAVAILGGVAVGWRGWRGMFGGGVALRPSEVTRS